MDDVSALRRDYTKSGLTESELAGDPLAQFSVWFDAAVAAGVHEPNAMTLATADATGRPSARTVLLKGVDAHGFTFFTNRGSRKGSDLAENPRAALVFRWDALERQVTVAGPVEQVSDAESDAYFASRPLGSRIGAWTSAQSSVIGGRRELDERRAEVERRFADGDVPRPPFWGGYRVLPEEVEFWQGRPDRLHDRLRYRRSPGGWLLERLSP